MVPLLFAGNQRSNLLLLAPKPRPSTVYRALASLTSELLWLPQLLRPFQLTIDSIMVLCGNKLAIQLAENSTSNERSKHIDIDCHFIQQHVTFGFLKLIHPPTHQQLADVFIKALPHCKFSEFICKLGALDIYASNLRGRGVSKLTYMQLANLPSLFLSLVC